MRNKQIIKELLIWTLILFGSAYFYNQYVSYQEASIAAEKLRMENRMRESQQKQRALEKRKRIEENRKEGAIEIAYVSPKKISFWSKSKLLEKRKVSVENSPLKPKFYSPSKDIFSKYDDSRPFFLERGSGIYDVVVTEPIENPMILVGLNNSLQFIEKLPDYFYDNELCMPEKRSIVDILQAQANRLGCKISHFPDKNKIEVTYPMRSFDIISLNKYIDKYPYFYTLTGLNARDMGYKYMKPGTYLNINWRDKGVIRDYEKYEFKDYIGVERFSPFHGGVHNNKILPHQPELDFRITKLPARIEMTLYKNEKDTKGLKYIIHFVEEEYLNFPELVEYTIKEHDYQEETKNMSNLKKQEFLYSKYKETHCDRF